MLKSNWLGAFCLRSRAFPAPALACFPLAFCGCVYVYDNLLCVVIPLFGLLYDPRFSGRFRVC